MNVMSGPERLRTTVYIIYFHFVNANNVCQIPFLNYKNICSQLLFSFEIISIGEVFQLTVNILFPTGYSDRQTSKNGV
jgi:hypothetical protein